MNTNQALSALSLTEHGHEYTQKEIKKAYKSAMILNHPDKQNGCTVKAQFINEAYAILSKLENVTYQEDDSSANLNSRLSNALNFAQSLNDVTIELCGSWLWVSGETYHHREQFMEHGFLYSRGKKSWYFNGEMNKKYKKRGSYSMDKIRQEHGSEIITSRKEKRAIEA